MAFVHNASVEFTKSELDIFDFPPTQTSIEKSFFIEVQPIAALADNAPLEFFISGSGEYYFDLNNTLLFISCRVVKTDNSAIVDGSRVALINYPLATLFNQVDITLGDQLISQSDNLYSYRAYIETLLNYSAQTLSSQFTSGLFYKDTAGHHNVRILDGTNAGFNKRALAIAHSKPVDLLGPIFGDIFNQPKLILNGLDLKIKLTRNKDSFCLMSAEADPFKVQIMHACLYVKRVQISLAVRIGHSQAMLTATAKYSIDRVCMKVYSIPSALYLDGQQIPSQPFKPIFNIDLAVREYMALAHISGKQKSDCTLSIDREEFTDGFTFFAIDLSADQEPGGHFSLMKTELNNRREVLYDFY
ncbi:uncharacterized protein F54H12.2-like [Phyllobates terribilis]|uniref:uncharacterized protein F54H12.2-like n=1 Tax=Phyllobates terribilis TaxID=111132 RepID=UPI003CCB46C1